MSVRTTRWMTSILLTRDDQLLLLYRIGSRAVPDSWVGLGGHVEGHEISDPTRAILREVDEEVGVGAEHLASLSLRYLATRDTGTELRTTFYFTAELTDQAVVPETCDEGLLRWFPLDAVPEELEMPPTAGIAVRHWLGTGRRDDLLRSIVMTEAGAEVRVLANG